MNTDHSFNFPIRTSHEENALSSINLNPLSMRSIDTDDIDSVSSPPGFELSGIGGSSFDSPNGFNFVANYPSDWQKVKTFISPSNTYAQNDQNIISLFGQFKATCFTEGRKIENISYLFDVNNGKLESLASISPESVPAKATFSIFKLVPKQNHNKFSIVKRILSNKYSTQNLNTSTRLFFSIIAQNGELRLGKTNWIEIHSQMNQEPLVIGERVNLGEISLRATSPINQEPLMIDKSVNFGEISLRTIYPQINQKPLTIDESVNFGEISLGATYPQINQEPLKASKFILILSKPNAKCLFFKPEFGFPFSLKYPENWKNYNIKVVEENTWADQYNIHNEDVILSCQFKATCRDGLDIMEKTADLLQCLPNNRFKCLAKIKLESIDENLINCRLISINQQPKSILIKYILQKEISHNTINQVANLFFRIIAYHQGQIVDQTNWLEVPGKKNKDNLKNPTRIKKRPIKSRIKKRPIKSPINRIDESIKARSDSNILDIPKTSDHPDTIQNNITPMFKHEDTQQKIEKKVKKIQEKSQNDLESFTQQYKEEIKKRFQVIKEQMVQSQCCSSTKRNLDLEESPEDSSKKRRVNE